MLNIPTFVGKIKDLLLSLEYFIQEGQSEWSNFSGSLQELRYSNIVMGYKWVKMILILKIKLNILGHKKRKT